MAKYDPLKQWLMEARGDRTPLTFLEIETLLEFPLPASARTHRPWWANTPGGHSHALAWLDAGWRTTAVNLERERLVFERKPVKRGRRGAKPAAAERPDPATAADLITLPRALLSAGAVRLIESLARSTGSDVAAAAAALLNQAALERALRAPAAPDDSLEF